MLLADRTYFLLQRKLSALLSALFVITAIFFPDQTVYAAHGVASRLDRMSRPRLANYYVSWDLKAEDLPDLAHWNLVILDMEHQTKHPDYIKKLRELNPSIVILAYITSQEITDGSIDHLQERAPLRYELLQGVRSEWYLKNPQGKRFSFWQNTFMLNVTAYCPAVDGSTWNSYLAQFVTSRLASSGLWDGVLYDNVWQNVDWFTKTRGGLDMDGDGTLEPAERIDAAWHAGYELLVAQTRRLAPENFLVFANVGLGHSAYASSFDGVLFEHFPGFGWSYAMREATVHMTKGKSPLVIFNSTSKTQGNSADWRAMRFGFTSALLVDAFFSFDHGDQHAELWWYDEYGIDLGKPVGKAFSVSGGKNFNDDSVWRRDFTRGIVLVNPTPGRRTVLLGGAYKKISGTQDAITNSGEIVTKVTIEARDGIVLQKVPSLPIHSVFINGAQARTVSLSGAWQQSSTVLFTDAAPSGGPAYVGDMIDDSALEGFKIAGAKFEVWGNGKLLLSGYPFGIDYSGAMSLAIARKEAGRPGVFALAQKQGGQVVVYDTTGKKLVTMYPLGMSYQGGFTLTFADVSGDAQEELIVGTGKGEQAQVLVYDQTYLTIIQRLNPFDHQELSGISVAARKPPKHNEPVFFVLSQGVKPVLAQFTSSGKKIAEFSVKRSRSSSTLDVRITSGSNPALRVEEY